MSTWSSGTGGSGLFGALSFAALTTAGLSARKTVLLMLVVPVIMALTFFIILDHGKQRERTLRTVGTDRLVFSFPFYFVAKLFIFVFSDAEPLMKESQDSFKDHLTPINMKSKCRMLPKMARFIVPLALVYLFEYFINQGVVSNVDMCF